MHKSLLRHIERHFHNYKLLVVGSAVAAIVGAVASIVYDNLAPHPWDVHFRDQQQAIQTGRAEAFK